MTQYCSFANHSVCIHQYTCKPTTIVLISKGQGGGGGTVYSLRIPLCLYLCISYNF